MNKKKLDTLIEKEIYQLVEKMKIHVDSFVQLYSRRKGLKLDDNVLNELSKAMLAGLDDGFMVHIDSLKKNLDKVLLEYLESETPVQLTTKVKKTT